MNRLIILGTAQTLAATPWDLDGVDYWACAPVITHKPSQGHRIDAIFEFHEDEYWKQPKIIERFNKYAEEHPDVKIYMRNENPPIRNSIKYPLAEVQSCLNHPRMRNYFTSTIAYMVALAIMQGYKKLELYGIHMASEDEEYSGQRSCIESLLAWGWGKGVNFWLPDESDIMKSTYLYGYEQENGFLLKTINFKKSVKQGALNLEKKLEEMKRDFWMQEGGVVALDKYITTLRKQGLS